MSIFEKLFSRKEPIDEGRLVTVLGQLSEELGPLSAFWAATLGALQAEYAGALSSGAPIDARYRVVRKIEAVFGGMGSLNDLPLEGECERLRLALFAAVQDLLRGYWRELGPKTQEESIAPFPDGAHVRLVPGKIRFYNRDETAVVVEDTDENRSQTWRIVRFEGPDITDMPSYLVSRGSTFMVARREALALDETGTRQDAT